GHKITYAYDANDRRTAQLTAEGYLTLYEYDVAGNQTARKAYTHKYSLGAGGAMPTPDANDTPRITTAEYDKNDRVTKRTNAAGVVTTYEYDAVGNQTAEVTSGRRRETHYDLADRVFETVDAANVTTRFVLDAVGNVLTRYDAYNTAAQR